MFVPLGAFQLVDQLIVLYAHHEHILPRVQAYAVILKQDIIHQQIHQNPIFVLLDIILWLVMINMLNVQKDIINMLDPLYAYLIKRVIMLQKIHQIIMLVLLVHISI